MPKPLRGGQRAGTSVVGSGAGGGRGTPRCTSESQLSALFRTTLQPVAEPLHQELVDDAAALGEDALDGTAWGVGENEAIASDAQATVTLQRRLERLDVAALVYKLAQSATQTVPRLGRQPTNGVDDLASQDDFHSSSALRGRNCVRPAL